MKQNVIAAAILAFGLIVAAFLFAGRYTMTRLDENTVARVDRWTGRMTVCSAYYDGLRCRSFPRAREQKVAVEDLTAENLVIENDINAMDPNLSNEAN